MIHRTDKTMPQPDTRARLIAAAATEFNTRGFSGTDTNRIARAAGFAPQTFYRHFADKTAIFIRVYEQWQHDEREKIAIAMRAASADESRDHAIARSLLDAHGDWAVFRRSLRLIALEDDRVRAVRAASRRAQLATLGITGPERWAQAVAALLMIERLCDAAADAEIDDLGIGRAEWIAIVATALAALREARPGQSAARRGSPKERRPKPT